MPPDVIENTAYSQKIAEGYHKSLKRKEQYKREQEKKKKKKKKKAAAATPHASTKEPLTGVLAKGDKYAQRAHDYLLTDGGRNKVYQDLSHAHLARIPAKKLANYKFPGGPAENFNPSAKTRTGKKAGQAFPYVWEAHHMLPGSAFYFEFNGKPCFTAPQRRLILQSEYNINHGHNMINLPDQAWAVPIHRLIQHPGDHENYTGLVMRNLRELSQKLQALADRGQPHDKLKEKIFEKLRELEDECWDLIVKLGRQSVKKVLAGKVLVEEYVRYGTKESPKKYKWGALC
ncbi:AHH domain-containing protein [Hyalangium versicolor]|uniref:AHH domain-containing protein n=1 Tax=Hyalangium versicolor TaxID=2861190 RepID=UPI001CCCC304|nr:AHH domain-containing protein [Hyalangium versicolor]